MIKKLIFYILFNIFSMNYKLKLHVDQNNCKTIFFKFHIFYSS